MIESTTLEDFKAARQAQVAEATTEYRRLVQGLAEGKPDEAVDVDAADPILARLEITDKDVIEDVRLYREREELIEKISGFERKRPEIDEKVATLTKEIAEIRKILLTGDNRLGQAQHERRVVGGAYQKSEKWRTRVSKIEAAHPRMFG